MTENNNQETNNNLEQITIGEQLSALTQEAKERLRREVTKDLLGNVAAAALSAGIVWLVVKGFKDMEKNWEESVQEMDKEEQN